MKLSLTNHIRKVIAEKGFDEDTVRSVALNPDRVTDVVVREKYTGQKRACGKGLAVVYIDEGDTRTLITCYLDKVRTPLRKDQLNDPLAVNSRRATRAD